uniref:Iso_dh domain-containing protein n=1 Tax=Macrostomum lignano TaxID=282301 RepID=A0A1I8FNK4_9PLAT
MDGDEMTRIIWASTASTTIWVCPHRDATDDQVTIDAANAMLQIQFCGIKCRHHHADEQPYRRIQAEKDVAVAQRHHPQNILWRHTCSREADHLQERAAPSARLDRGHRDWPAMLTATSTKRSDLVLPKAGKVELLYTPADGSAASKVTVFDFQDGGEHHLKRYDGRFKDIFQEVHDKHYAAEFKKLGVLGKALIVLTLTHIGEQPERQPDFTNPVASIFAWTRGLSHRGKLDGNQELQQFAQRLEKACCDTVTAVACTKDFSWLHLRAEEREAGAVPLH